MPISSSDFRKNKFADLLQRDHTLNGAVLLGLDGYPIEVQARATSISPSDRCREVHDNYRNGQRSRS